MTATTAPEIRLHCRACQIGGGYVVVFDGPDPEPVALAYLEARRSTHSVAELDDAPIDDRYEKLLALLYPTCEHGLSESLCAGLGHYPGPMNTLGL